MLISRSWLADFISIDKTTAEIGEQLTALGLEVDSISKSAPDFSGVVVGRVLSVTPHPNADKLKVTSVDIGQENALQIVCGANNVKAEALFPVAIVGAILPGGFKITKRTMRGIESQGILCSDSELGLSEASPGLMTLPKDFNVGDNIRQALNLDDEILEISLTPDRGDCWSVLGVARELSVAYQQDLTIPEVKAVAAEDKALTSPNITLSAPDACPSYAVRTISGLNNRLPSPLWLVERLRRAGIRSVSPIVDVTNYVMLAYGTPMHAFASKAIDGNIDVRWASNKETLTLLNGQSIVLDDDMLVIADRSKSLALAGIMGGDCCKIDESSTTIVLESAWFAPQIIRGRGQRIALSTDASQRYERGVDYKLQLKTLEYASQLICQICGGHLHTISQAFDTAHLPENKPITLRTRHLDAVLGIRFPKRKIPGILSRLGLQASEVDKGVYSALSPSWRFDLSIEEDLIEELTRVWGYAHIPIATTTIEHNAHPQSATLVRYRQLANLLTHRGYSETISYSFIDDQWEGQLANKHQKIALINPISADLGTMRTSLLPSLAKTLTYNVSRQQSDVRLYEWGHVYHKNATGQIEEIEKLAGIATGNVHPMQWGYRERMLDFFDVKGDVELLFEALGIVDDISYRCSQRQYLHPGQAADIFYDGQVIGFVATIHPTIQKKLGIDTKILAFELDIAKITQSRLPVAQSIVKYPEVRRDIALLMAQGHQATDVMAAIASLKEDLLTRACLFDVYIGRNIPKNTKSVAIAIYLQDKQKTLTDERSDAVVRRVIEKLTQTFNAQLRG